MKRALVRIIQPHGAPSSLVCTFDDNDDIPSVIRRSAPYLHHATVHYDLDSNTYTVQFNRVDVEDAIMKKKIKAAAKFSAFCKSHHLAKAADMISMQLLATFQIANKKRIPYSLLHHLILPYLGLTSEKKAESLHDIYCRILDYKTKLSEFRLYSTPIIRERRASDSAVIIKDPDKRIVIR